MDKPCLLKMDECGLDRSTTGSEDNGLRPHDESPGKTEEKDTMALCIFFLRRRVHWLPIITAIFIICSFFISYAVSVTQGNVEPDFPYISHTAIKAPERCIFAQLINTGAFLLAANIYVKFLQQREQFKIHSHQLHGCSSDRRLYIASLVVGWLSAFGLSIVANFQTIDMRPVHYTGAGLAFGLGLAYCWLQTSLSLRHSPRACVTKVQLVNSIVLSFCLVTFAVSKTIFKIKENTGQGTKHDILRGVYLVSTISEWLTAIAIDTFVLTFYPGFKRIILKGPRVVLLQGQAQPITNGNAVYVPDTSGSRV